MGRGRQTLHIEAKALERAAERLGTSFEQAVQTILSCKGKVILSGLGKSGHIARKIAATLSSTGTPAFFLHPGEAMHGDFGMIGEHDIVLAIAFGGQTREVLAVCRYAKEHHIPSIAITGKLQSPLAQAADVLLDGSITKEADSHNLAPTSSTTVALGLGDALAVTLMEARNFQPHHFAQFHPGGSLGLRLQSVESVMRPTSELNLCSEHTKFEDIVQKVNEPNFGIIAVVKNSKLLGSISDGDVRRAILEHKSEIFEMQAYQLMTTAPKTITSNASVMEAIALMEHHSITSVFVGENDLKGIVRIHDLLAAKVV